MITKLAQDIQNSVFDKLAMIRTNGFKNYINAGNLSELLGQAAPIRTSRASIPGLNRALGEAVDGVNFNTLIRPGRSDRINDALRLAVETKKNSADYLRPNGIYPAGSTMPGGTHDIRQATNSLNADRTSGMWDSWRAHMYPSWRSGQ
jgi:hypothetical protein